MISMEMNRIIICFYYRQLQWNFAKNVAAVDGYVQMTANRRIFFSMVVN